MKLIGWAIALAAAMATPAAAQQATTDETATVQAAQDPVALNEIQTMAPEPLKTTAPTPGVGEPVPGGWGTQLQVTEIGRDAAFFHDYWLLLLCAVISLFVLGLLLYVIVRYRRGANPVPSRTSHNTTVEVVWTVVPVLILVAIAIPSIQLMRAQYSPPPADLTVKVIGHQWYWSYEYPDHGVEIISNMLKECDDPALRQGERCRTGADGPPLLAVDERMVIPAGQVVKFIVTASDVIHSFAVPAFWEKIDANPGMLNETWVKVDRPGVYFGQCSELCGARHAYMPIAVEVLPPAQFAAWVASKGGTMPGGPGATPVEAPAGVEAGAPQPAGTPEAAEPALPTPAVANRATAQN
ncbi:MAG TPA: cytochrome c oxidase subunit II [Sphingomicrobium sp.]|nr:cytochrome c oxidase subunit II [Sphingomicrobium sp.]